MIDVVVHDRVVVVLGRGRVSVDPTVHVATAAHRGIPLLVLTLGYPVSEGQRAFVGRATDEAFHAGIRLDAQIVAGPAGVPAHLGATDDVTIVAAGRGERRIGTTLDRLPP